MPEDIDNQAECLFDSMVELSKSTNLEDQVSEAPPETKRLALDVLEKTIGLIEISTKKTATGLKDISQSENKLIQAAQLTAMLPGLISMMTDLGDMMGTLRQGLKELASEIE